MKLYNYFRSSASFRVRIAFNLKGLAYDYCPIHLARGEQRLPEYATLSKDALVPLLDMGSEKLSQSMAIIEYLDETCPAPPLLPPDALGRAKVRALSQSIACDIHPLNNLRVLQYLSKEAGMDEATKNQWCYHWVYTGLEAFERQLQQVSGQFCYGDTVSMADCCLVPQVFNAQRYNVECSGFTRIMHVFTNCMQLAAFEKARPEHCPDAQ